MVIALLLFLLVAALGGLGFVGYRAFQLHTNVTRLQTELSALRERHEQDDKRWGEYEAKVKAQHQELVTRYNEDTKRLKTYAAALRNENEKLSKWKDVEDAEVKAGEMLRTAETTLSQAEANARTLVDNAERHAAELATKAADEAQSLVAKAKEAADSLASETRASARALKAEAQGILDSATSQAAKVIESANQRAQEIGGSAYVAMQNATQYEKTVKAMKNIIDGCGDEYIIPQQSLLDGLADDFSHTQAGQELKRAREATKVMIRNRTAATCAYVEANRRDTAVNFVVDAFNGKVDSCLSRVKHDNAGKLGQQIRDAYTLVNYNGKAFRDAQITEAYLSARLEELKWAAIVQQLALEEREEQRRIKEQIREEARAAKERERVLREAAKEEDTLRRAMEQAQEQFEHAAGEQKAMYEQRLQEMGQKLRESEERKERARSMAEQTKKGYVYIISNVGSLGQDIYKIGLTRRWDPLDRIRELGDSSVPFGFDVHAMILSDDAPALEQRLHEHFRLCQVNKVNPRKEFFRASLEDIRNELGRLGVTNGIHWTLTAEAKDYRESLVIESAIKSSPAEREAWLRRQRRVELAATGLAESVDISADEDSD